MELSKRQKEIIESSLKIIGEGGIQSLTIKNISKKVGISEPAIYRHFDSKSEILIAILDLFIENNKKIFNSKQATETKLQDIINALFNNFIQTFLQHPHLISIVFSEEIFRNDEVFRKKTKSIIDGNYTFLISIIKNGQENGYINKKLNPKSLTTMILGSLRLCVKRWQMEDYSFDLKNECAILKETILKILLK